MRADLHTSSTAAVCLVLGLWLASARAAEPTWEDRLKQGLQKFKEDRIWEGEKLLVDCYQEAQKFPEDDPRRTRIALYYGKN